MRKHGTGKPYELGRLLRESGPLTRRQIRLRTGWSRNQTDYAIERGTKMAVIGKRMEQLSLEQAGGDFYRLYGLVFYAGARLDDECDCMACGGRGKLYLGRPSTGRPVPPFQ